MAQRSLECFGNAWCMRELGVEGLPITHTTAQELRSRLHGDMGVEFFWEQAPQLRMVLTLDDQVFLSLTFGSVEW